ncbi:hypothetical protein ABEF93_001168 [Exophiala dermatitidis]
MTTFPQLGTPNTPSLKRKRGQKASCSSLPAQASLPSERPRTSTRHTAEEQEIEKHTRETVADPVQNWVLNETWTPEYFEPDEQAQEELSDHDSWLEEMMAQSPIPVVQYVERNGFGYPLPVKRAPASLRRKQSDSSLTESSEKDRERKSTSYRDARYTTMLETKGSFLRDFDHNIPQAILDICQRLLARDQIIPQNSLFCDDLFGKLCWKIQERNEAMVIQDVTRLIVPSAMNLAIYGDTHLDSLIESVNEAWVGSIPVEGPRPQPDYAVGFGRSAFTTEQLKRLGPLVGSVFDTSYFVATYRIMHSMTIAVRSIVELYRAVKREKELDREILAFSISHDQRLVRIYGHYPVIDGDKVTFYRHPIHEFSFTALEGKDKWTAYKFTKNVYDVWMPTHLKRICSAVDQLPSSLDFQTSDEPGAQPEEATGPSQDMGSLLSDPDNIDLASQEDEPNPFPQTATPDTSVSKGVGQGKVKRAKTTRVPKEPTGG